MPTRPFPRRKERPRILTNSVAALLGLTALFGHLPRVSAQTLFWDANGATAGSGNVGGTWDTGTNWSANSAGTAATTAWITGRPVAISAGGDGTGTWTLTLAGTVSVPSLAFEETGNQTISGGTITGLLSLTSGVAAGAANAKTLATKLTGTGLLTKWGAGDVRFTDTNTYTGGTTLRGGALTVATGGSITHTGAAMTVASTGGDVASLQVIGGGSVRSSTLTLGSVANAQGTAKIDGTGSNLQTSAAVLIGNGGIGALNLSGGGTMTITQSVVNNQGSYVGALAGSSGAISVDGAGSVLTSNGNFRMGEYGTARLDITNGGVVNDRQVTVGFYGGSSGQVNVSGAGSTWTNSDILYVGLYASGPAGAPGGVVNITAGGQASVAGGLAVGVYSSTVTNPGIGVVNIDGSGSKLTVVASPLIARSGKGTVNVTNGGRFESGTVGGGAAVLGQFLGANGTVNLSGSSTWLNRNNLYLGYSNNVDATTGVGTAGPIGTLNISGGSTVSQVSASLGFASSGKGTVEVSGVGSSWTTSGALYLGSSGTGNVTVSDGANASAATTYLGYNAGSTGSLKVNGTSGNRGRFTTGSLIGGGGTVGAATRSLTLDGGILRASAANTTFLSGFTAGQLSLASGGGFFDTNGFAIGTDNGFAGVGGLTKQGAGALELRGASTYAGGTSVETGTLFANNSTGSATGTGAVTVQSGAKLGGSGTISGQVTIADDGHLAPGNSPGVLTTGTLTLSSAAILDYEFGQADVSAGIYNDLTTVNGDLTLDGTLNVALSSGGAFTPGSYRVFDYSGALTDNTLELGTLPAGAIANVNTFVQTSIANEVNLVTSNGTAFSYWDGDALANGTAINGAVDGGDGIWANDIANGNWTESTGALNGVWNDQIALFGGTAGTVKVDSTSNGPVVFQGAQFSTDGYVIEANAAGDQLRLDVVPNAAITVDPGLVATMNVPIAGDAGTRLLKEGTGTLILGGANIFSGETYVNGGTLLIHGDQTGATGLINVSAGAALGGRGVHGGDVLVLDEGSLLGVAGETLTMKTLFMETDLSRLDVTLGVPSGSRLFAMKGGLVLDGTLNITDAGGFGPGIYRLADYAGTLTDNTLDFGAVPGGFVPGTDLFIQTSVAGAVNLVNTKGILFNYWDGENAAKNDGMIDGGAGTWRTGNPPGGSDYWTEITGSINAGWQDGARAVFGRISGDVKVKLDNGDVIFSGADFLADGYRIYGERLTTDTAQTKISVVGGATATIESEIAGSGGLDKIDRGTLVLKSANTYTGGTLVEDGTVVVAANGALGQGNVNITANATERGYLYFQNATAGQLNIDNAGRVEFLAQSNADQATILNHYTGGGDETGTVYFRDNAGAGTATIINEDGNPLAGEIAAGAFFFDDSSAQFANITNNGGLTEFFQNATAGNATIANNAGGLTVLYSGIGGTPSAGQATITNNAGGMFAFGGHGDAKEATVINNAGGIVDVSLDNAAGPISGGTGSADIGSLSGAGAVYLGGTQLTLGGLNRDEEISGTIRDGSSPAFINAFGFDPGFTGGSLQKVGSGDLTLSGVNSYTGGTIVSAGHLKAARTGALGTGAVVVNSSANLDFLGTTSAQVLSITNYDGANTFFFNTTTAGSATIETYGDGTVTFTDSSTAGTATITNYDEGGTQFGGNSSAGRATIVNIGASGGPGSGTFFAENSTAGNATITNHDGSFTLFFGDGGTPSMGRARITNLAGGGVAIAGPVSGVTGTIINQAGAFVDISGTAPDFPFAPGGPRAVTIGSLSGAGDVYLGESALTVGTLNRNDVIDGVLRDGSSPKLISELGDRGYTGGSLVKAGSGTLTLAADNLYTGDTTVAGGTLLLEGSVVSPATRVQSAGTLRGTGFAGGDLVNGGVVAPGNGAPGALRVGGDFSQSSSGTLSIRVGGSGAAQHDLLAITGSATLGGKVAFSRLNEFRFSLGEKLTFLTADGGVNGTFAFTLNPFATDRTIGAKVVYEGDSVSLVGVRTSFATVVKGPNEAADPGEQTVQTQNQLAAATALDASIADPRLAKLVEHLDSESLDKVVRDLDRLAPEELTSLYQLSIGLARVQTLNLQRRLSAVRHGASGFSADGFTAPVAEGPSTAPDKDSRFVLEPNNDGRFGVFITGVGESIDVDTTANARGYNIRTGGFTLGADCKVTSNFAVGVAAGYANSNVDFTGNGHGEVDGGKLALYATYHRDGFYVDAGVQGGLNSYDYRRQSVGGSARGRTDGHELHTFLSTGYDVKVGAFDLGAFAGLEYTRVDINGYRERGSLAPLDAPNQHQDSTRSSLGLRAAYDWRRGAILIRPEIRAAWQHEFGDASTLAWQAKLPGGTGPQFTTHGPRTARDNALLSAGASVQWSESAAASLFYDGEFARENYQSHNLSLSLKLQF